MLPLLLKCSVFMMRSNPPPISRAALDAQSGLLNRMSVPFSRPPRGREADEIVAEHEVFGGAQDDHAGRGPVVEDRILLEYVAVGLQVVPRSGIRW
jgi:hypothetical protein